jgi:hypothetical protein
MRKADGMIRTKGEEGAGTHDIFVNGVVGCRQRWRCLPNAIHFWFMQRVWPDFTVHRLKPPVWSQL